ncbi:hypothetical protein J7E62_30015 [Variovorax paradoxus]|nr:hypothetical protein [Variovorax paradoxus]
MKFITLGPTGSNHEFVTGRYLDFHDLRERATIALAPDFERCTEAVLQGSADFMIQCAVHPAAMSTVAKYFEGLYVIDTFISASQDLAIIHRNDAEQPQSLAVMLPTLHYVDHSQWERIELVDTVAEVTRGLVEGKYSAGLGYASIVRTHPEVLHIAQFVGSVDDAWIVYGLARVSAGRMSAWRDSPAGLLYGQTI